MAQAMTDQELSPGDWAKWKDRPVIVVKKTKGYVEIKIWVPLEELRYVPKH